MSRLQESDFDREFRRGRTFMKVWFVFIFSMAMTIFGVVGYTLFTVASDPSIIGETIGKIEKGYEKEAM